MDTRSILARELEALKLSVKYHGYDLARALTASQPPREPGHARYVGLESKPSTQADIQSDWMAHWCAELKTPVNFHRKVWEYGFMLQALHNHDMLLPGKRGLGFGCGLEPLPSYFAQHGIDVTMTDLAPEAARAAGWVDTNQHTGSLGQAFYAHLVTHEAFDRHVELRYVDMNAIDPTLADYDFCWSICAFEHLGSIEHGLAFISNAMATLKPGGIAVHTTEFNFADDEQTLEDGSTVLFQRRHFTALAERLRAQGHAMAPLNFDVGNLPLDKFIDVPPYAGEMAQNLRESWGEDSPHIKLTIGGFACTCFGIVVQKA